MTGILHFVFNLLGNVVRQHLGLIVIDLGRLYHHANLPTCLHGVGLLNTVVGIGDAFQLLKAFDVALHAFAARAGTGGRDGVVVDAKDNSRVAQDFTALGASAVSLPRGRRLDAFFDGTYDMIEIEDFSWVGERDNSLAGVYAYSMDSSFPYWALCFSGTGRARIPGESWSALFDAAREGTAAGVSLLAQAGSEGRSLFIKGGGECNVINLRSFVEDAPSDRNAAVARLDPVLKKELEEIAALKNLTDFGG